MSQGFMMVLELTTCRVPEDPASPALMEGYVVVFTLIPPLIAIVLQPGAAQSEPFGDLAYRGLCDSV
jgi:hypothetical protein